MKKCFFIGHREAPDSIFPQLLDTIKIHICNYDVSEFLVGGYGNFDRLAARAVAMIKREFPHIRLLQLLPYHPASRPSVLPAYFDGSLYPFEDNPPPPRLSIVQANRFAVRRCDFLICFVKHPASNAQKLVDYARKVPTISIVNIGE